MSTPTGETPGSGGLLARVVEGARSDTAAGLVRAVWREDEITAAIGRHPQAENDLWHSTRIVMPAVISPAWDTGFVFRGHVREILERVAAGEDTRPGTAAECCVAMASVSMAIPLHGASAGFYHRMWRKAFPDHPVTDDSVIDHYEFAEGNVIDRHERVVRRKLLVPGRRLDLARIDCDGEHYGRPVACKYQRPGASGGT